MAKPAKAVEKEVTDKAATKFLREVLQRYENIESARGVYMNRARREREAMTVIYEGMAQLGVSQKASKLNVKIARTLQKIKGWLADLEIEDRRMAEKLAKAQKDKGQLLLFGELPKQAKPKREPEQEKFSETIRKATSGNGELEKTEPVGSA